MNEISKETRFTIDIHEANRAIKRERHHMKTLITTKNNAKFMSKVDMSGHTSRYYYPSHVGISLVS